MRAILTYTDFEVGRLVNHLKEIGQLDNTLIFISIGDNGASKEGSLEGSIDRSIQRKPVTEEENVAYNLAKIDKIGTPDATRATIRWAGRRPPTRRSATGNQMPTAKAERTILSSSTGQRASRTRAAFAPSTAM
jgi:arylsulfatase A-like enzyme